MKSLAIGFPEKDKVENRIVAGRRYSQYVVTEDATPRRSCSQLIEWQAAREIRR